jgi:hypothetical protein
MANTWHREYRPEFFDTLPHYDDAKAVVPPDDFLQASGALLNKWSLHDFVGITLLHQHFPVAPNEYLMRTFSKAENCITGRSGPVPDQGTTIEYMWRYMTIDGQKCLAPVEFLTSTDPIKGMDYHSLLARIAIGFHEDFTEILSYYDLERFFGISLLPGWLFDLSGQRSLVENSDAHSFILRPQQEGDDPTGTQTIYAFGPQVDPQGIICVMHICHMHRCSHHSCNVHCKVHCRKHCGVHCHHHKDP